MKQFGKWEDGLEIVRTQDGVGTFVYRLTF